MNSTRTLSGAHRRVLRTPSCSLRRSATASDSAFATSFSQSRFISSSSQSDLPSPSPAPASTSRTPLRYDYFTSISAQSSLFSHVPPPASSLYPESVRIVEVGARDGLQNESCKFINTALKVDFINKLSNTGITTIEAGSFVSPKWVPFMADSADVLKQIKRSPHVKYAALTPNIRGLQDALAANVSEVAVFAAASESFSMANLNCSIEESLNRFVPILKEAKAANIPVRGYVSCVVGCPYEGWITPEAVAHVSRRLLEMGCYEISLGDTIGIGTPGLVSALLTHLKKTIPADKLAVHFHDTYGQALSNILIALQHGISVIDSSVSGLGGCPYAKGATGNVATEDVVFMLHGSGINTGIDLSKLLLVSEWISEHLGKPMQSRAGKALIQGKRELEQRERDLRDMIQKERELQDRESQLARRERAVEERERSWSRS